MRFLEALQRRFGGSSTGPDRAVPALPVAPMLRARFQGVTRLFSAGRAHILHAVAGREGAAPDPAKILFPDSGPADAAQGRGVSLGLDLTLSAQEMSKRHARLDEGGRALAGAIEDRLDGEASLITQGVRVIIAGLWAIIALSLAWVSRGGAAPWAPFLETVRAEDAAALFRAFAILSGAGLGVAFAVALFVYALGKADNARLRAKGSELGSDAGAFALDFDAELDRLRNAMDGRKENPAEAVTDLSRAHLTALEAAIFFRRMQFLTDSDRGEATRKFRGFLRAASGGGYGGGAGLQTYILGFLTGVFVMGLMWPAPIPLPIEVPDLSNNYPWAVLTILAGAFVYAIAGLVVATLRGPFTAGAERQARDEALDAVRSGFVSRNAPLIDSVIKRIEDALDVFKARLASRSKSSHADAAGDVPAWRKPPEGPRFIETNFAATPATFRVDPPSSDERKKRRLFTAPKPE